MTQLSFEIDGACAQCLRTVEGRSLFRFGEALVAINPVPISWVCVVCGDRVCSMCMVTKWIPTWPHREMFTRCYCTEECRERRRVVERAAKRLGVNVFLPDDELDELSNYAH